MPRKNTDKNTITVDVSYDDIETQLIDDYKQLEKNCDKVLDKIKKRKMNIKK